mmetsp:Transcript_29747/g.88970  ORF Transcript_29747/g.88970 Transcript_29747/m.88970 type:complete len:231 (+) Transcript_29747:660-1352(+)
MEFPTYSRKSQLLRLPQKGHHMHPNGVGQRQPLYRDPGRSLSRIGRTTGLGGGGAAMSRVGTQRRSCCSGNHGPTWEWGWSLRCRPDRTQQSMRNRSRRLRGRTRIPIARQRLGGVPRPRGCYRGRAGLLHRCRCCSGGLGAASSPTRVGHMGSSGTSATHPSSFHAKRARRAYNSRGLLVMVTLLGSGAPVGTAKARGPWAAHVQRPWRSVLQRQSRPTARRDARRSPW